MLRATTPTSPKTQQRPSSGNNITTALRAALQMETETEHFVDNYRKRYFNYVLHLLIKFFGNSRRDFFLDNGKKRHFQLF